MTVNYFQAASISTVAIGLISYCIYFDYKRRTDYKFRNELKNEQRMVDQMRLESQPLHSREKILESANRVLSQYKQVDLPTDPQKKEQFFMEVLAKGEQLCTSNNVQDLETACVLFYSGLQVYPVPQELIQLYQKSLPEKVFQLLVHVIALDSPQTPQSQMEQLQSSEPLVEELSE
eukprot:NODE_56_length_28873_cov_1.243101.p13 type:complete len:176 gc:universal NODE_56_length_28873_cov_1.243101:27359-26832(-)